MLQRCIDQANLKIRGLNMDYPNICCSREKKLSAVNIT